MKKAILLSAIAVISTLMVGPSADANPSCYMLDAEGNTVHLGHLCGETSSETEPSTSSSISTEPVTSTDPEPANGIEAAPTEAAPTEPISTEADTIYTPELIAEWMDGCIYGATGGAANVSADAINSVQAYCQCTIDTMQNRHTSDEFVAILDSTLAGSVPPALQDIIDYCASRIFG